MRGCVVGTNLTERAMQSKYELIQMPEEHAALLPPYADDVHGLVTVARHDQGWWIEMRLKESEIPLAVRELSGTSEVYLSQNRFKGSRRITTIWQIDAL